MRAILMLTVLTLAAPNREPAGPVELPRTPKELLMGDWFYENIANGRAPDGAARPDLMIRFTPGESMFFMNGKPSPSDGLSANVVIDWSKNPVTIDFVPKAGNASLLGILKLEGDQLTIAIQTGGSQRPTNFTSANLIGLCKRIR